MSDASLSAEELTALRDASVGLAGSDPSELPEGASPGSAASRPQVRPAQLAAPDRQIRRRLPTLEQRLGIIVRPHRQIVSTEFRTQLDVTLAPPEVASPVRMGAEVTSWQLGAVLRLVDHQEPIAWVGLPHPLAFHLIEVAFGTTPGEPGSLPPKRQLTAIEQETLAPFLEQVAKAFSDELHLARLGKTELVILPYPPSFGGLRTQESGLVLRAMIPMKEGQLPYTIVLLPKALEHIEPEEHHAVATEARAHQQRMHQNVGLAEVDVIARLGTVSVSVSTLTELSPGQVIWLEHNQSDPIELLVEGQPKFTAMPMQRAGAVGVAIVERI